MRNQIGQIPPIGTVPKILPVMTPDKTKPGTNFQYDLAGGNIDVGPSNSSEPYRIISFVPGNFGALPDNDTFNITGNIISHRACAGGVAGVVFVQFDSKTADKIPLKVGDTISGVSFTTLYFSTFGVYDAVTHYIFVAYDSDNK